jgi:dTDP-4-amino-4,6-dideoxygalactose transaminase
MIKHFGLDRQYTNLKTELLDATNAAMVDGILVDGPHAAAFSNWLALKTRCEYAILVHSGTQALEIIAKYLVYNNFDGTVPVHIRVPDLTYRATMNAFVNTSVYARSYANREFDIELTDVDKFGIMLPHDRATINSYNCYVGLYGAPTHGNHTVNDIIDGAQHWLIVNNGDVGLGMAISFDPTKNLCASGNGGAIVTNNEDLYNFAMLYRDNGSSRSADNLSLMVSGTNSKLSEIDCAHLLVRSKYIDKWQNRRREIRQYYISEFKNTPFRCLSAGAYKHADQKFVIAMNSDRDLMMRHLLKHKIEARIHYKQTISELTTAMFFCKTLDFLSVSTMLSRSVLSLPIYPELLDSEVEYIANMVKAFY